MKDTIKGAVKSKTMWLSCSIAALAPALEALPEARAFLGDNYGVALVILSAVMGLLRYLTTQSLADK